MNLPKPPPRTLKPDDERKVQLFLERVAPIVLEDPALSSKRWERMAQIAADMELTAEQFRSTLDDLLHRGVLKRIDISPPTPPPLPKRAILHADSTMSDEFPEEAFALTPPRFGPPPRRAAASPSDSPGPMSEPAKPSSDGSSGRELPRISARDPTTPANGEHRPAGSERSSGRWRLEGEPSPLPPAPSKRPHEIFLDYVRRSLAVVTGGIVSEELENRLMAHGTRLLTLSPVYARHLFQEVLSEKKLSCASSAARDPASSLPKGAPGEAGTDNDQPVSPAAPHDVPATHVALAQQERRAPFLEYVQRSLERLPLSTLAPQLLQQLISTGTDLFGLDRANAEETIRTVAGQRRIAVVTAEQAQKHLDDLISEFLGDEFVLSSMHRERLYHMGSQWGFSLRQIDQCIEKHVEANRKLSRRETLMTNTALAGAILSVVAVVVFLGYAFLGGRPGRVVESAPTRRPSPPFSTAPLDSSDAKADQISRLTFAIEQARKVFPHLEAALRDIASDDRRIRDAAYPLVVAEFHTPAAEDTQRWLLLEVVYRALAREPDDESAGRLAGLLLAAVPVPGENLPEEPGKLSTPFWSVRCVARALSHPDTRQDRARILGGLLDDRLDMSLPEEMSSEELEAACLTRLAERIYDMLIAAVSEAETGAAEMHAKVQKGIAGHIDADTLTRLNAKFDAAFESANSRS